MRHENEQCTLVRELMSQYKKDKTSDKAAEAIKAHLEKCEECRHYCNSFESASDTSSNNDIEQTSFINIAKRLKKRRIRVIISVIVLCAAACIFVSGTMPILQTSGNSMAPSFYDDDYILTSKLSYLMSSPERGDVVIAKTENSTVIKRIIAVPGDTVDIHDGELYINSQKCSKSYISSGLSAGDISYPVKLSSDEYFLMGDNPDCSNDSRFKGFGSVSRNDIILKVLFSVF